MDQISPKTRPNSHQKLDHFLDQSLLDFLSQLVNQKQPEWAKKHPKRTKVAKASIFENMYFVLFLY